MYLKYCPILLLLLLSVKKKGAIINFEFLQAFAQNLYAMKMNETYTNNENKIR